MHYYISGINGTLHSCPFELKDDEKEMWDIYLGEFETEEEAHKAYNEYYGVDYDWGDDE